MTTSWLITGGCGFIGTNLIGRLMTEEGHAIRVIDNLSVGTLEDLGSVINVTEMDVSDKNPLPAPQFGQCQLVRGDIIDADLALIVTKDIDIIVHLAANTGVGPSVEDPRLDCLVNVIGTFNYLEAARLNKVSRFIFASSGAPVGEAEPPIHEELAAHPVSPYGASKLAGEGYCSAYNRTFGIQTIALRFGNVYGPGSTHKSSVVAKFIKQALDNLPLEIYGDGTQTRDFIYIDDLIDAVMRSAIVNNIGGEVFQIATSKETTVQEMTEQLCGVLAERGIRDVVILNRKTRLGDVKRNYSDTSKAQKYLGWTVRFQLEEGLDETVSYFLTKQR
ncbi:UDP-glucose 4-epimerase [Gammaproteobacteria bacterium]